jgi:thioredoxin 2
MSTPLHIVCPHCDTTNRVPEEKLGDGAKCGKCKQLLFIRKPIALTQASFDRHIGASDIPVVVDFWASWCAPCRMMAPGFEQAAARVEPRVRLAKLDTEAEPGIASRYAIRGIPTMIAFKGGAEVARVSGALDAGSLLRWIEQHA